MQYIDSIRAPETSECVFCEVLQQAPAAANLVLCRGALVSVVMNRYPYTNGHLLVMPTAHGGDYLGVAVEVLSAWHVEIQRAVRVLTQELSCHGANIGMNLGRAAGAGIPDHLHCHVVPRWTGDTNFMPVLADVRVMSEHIIQSYERLAPHFCQP